MKANFLSNRKKLADAPFKRKDLGFKSNKEKKVEVFINESLTPRNKLLLKKALDRKKIIRFEVRLDKKWDHLCKGRTRNFLKDVLGNSNL